MKINVNNYESWFLDYYEGTLTAEKAAELFLFLEQHPDLKEEFNSFEIVELPKLSEDSFPDKQALKKINTPTSETINDWLIAELEGELNLQERVLLNSYIVQHPQYERERKLFSLTRLSANVDEKFPNKSTLLKRIVGQGNSSMRIWFAAAASLILLIGAWFAFRASHQQDEKHFAGNKKEILPSIKLKQNPASTLNNNSNFNLAESNSPLENKINKKNQLPSVVSNTENKSLASVEINSNSGLRHSSKLRIKKHKNINENNLVIKEKMETKSTIQSDRELFAFMKPKAINQIEEIKPFVFAERRYTPNATLFYSDKNENIATTFQTEKIVNDIKNFTVENVNKVTGQELLATNNSTSKLTFKSRLVRLAAGLVGKVTNNNVKVKTTFDPLNGNVAAYEVEMGKNKWQKQF